MGPANPHAAPGSRSPEGLKWVSTCTPDVAHVLNLESMGGSNGAALTVPSIRGKRYRGVMPRENELNKQQGRARCRPTSGIMPPPNRLGSEFIVGMLRHSRTDRRRIVVKGHSHLRIELSDETRAGPEPDGVGELGKLRLPPIVIVGFSGEIVVHGIEAKM
jgi:hypothetical protein